MTRIQFARVNGLVLHYSRSGPLDKPGIVFINPLGGDYRVWDRVVPEFMNDYSIVRYDQRGHGLSDCPPGPYSLRDFASDLAGLLAYLDLEEVYIVAVSIGGMIALEFAIHHPEKVKGMVLGDTAAKIGELKYWQERINAIQANGIGSVSEAVLSRWFSPSYKENHPEDYTGYHHMLTRMPVEGYTASCAALGSGDLREDVKKIQTRTLVVCGEEDSATPPDLVRTLSDALPNSRFELIKDCGHNPSIERPLKMAHIIKEFIQEK